MVFRPIDSLGPSEQRGFQFKSVFDLHRFLGVYEDSPGGTNYKLPDTTSVILPKTEVSRALNVCEHLWLSGKMFSVSRS